MNYLSIVGGSNYGGGLPILNAVLTINGHSYDFASSYLYGVGISDTKQIDTNVTVDGSVALNSFIWSSGATRPSSPAPSQTRPTPSTR